jgi:hypothetical protein
MKLRDRDLHPGAEANVQPLHDRKGTHDDIGVRNSISVTVV